MPTDRRRTSESGLSLDSQACHGNPSRRIAPPLPDDDAGKTAMANRRKGNKQAITTRLDPAVIARLKTIARDASGKPLYASVAGIIEAGIIAECDRIEAILDAALAGTAVSAERQRLNIKRNTTDNCGPLHR